MENLHLIRVRYIGPSNTKPSRVKLISGRFGESVTFALDQSYRDSVEHAQAWLADHGFGVVAQAEMGGRDHALLSDTFKPLRD